MSNIMNSEYLFKLTYEMQTNLDSMLGLIEKLDKVQNEQIEKEQCIQAMKDFVCLLKTKTDQITLSCSSDDENKELSCSTKPDSNFKMKNTKALIVDDNEINNYVVAQMLEHFDIAVDIALSGESAIELFKENSYDIVLMDYLMPPGIDGIETVARIRDIGERGKNQLIIGLTANTVAEFKEGLNKYGVELIIFKPVKFEQMAVILKKELPDKLIYV